MNIIQNGLFKTLFLFSILYCFSLFLYGEPLPAGPPPYEYSWMVCKEKVEGNQKGYLIKLTSLLLKNPNSPYAPLVVDEMSRVLGNQGRNEFAFQTVKLLLNQEIQNGYVYVKLLELYSDLLKKHGKKENLKKRGLFRGYLRKWQILGPFGKVGSSLLYQSFPVENDQQFASLDMKKSYQGAFGEVHWQPFVVKKDNWIAPGNRIKPNRGCIYAVTHIYFPQSQAFILQLDPAPLMKLWINGKLAYQSKTHFSRNISRIRIPLKLPKGWSRFFVKLAPTSSYSNYSSFRIRFLNRKGFPLSLNISHLAFHPYSKYGFKIYTGPLQPWPLKYFQNKAKANQSFWAKVALSWLETFHGKSPKAIYRLEKLMNIGKENPYFLYIYIQALRRASFISDHIFQNKALKLYQKCEGLDPSFHLASLLFKINYLSRQGKSAKAYRLITQELKSCKYPLALLISGMNICDNEEWLPQALEFAQKGLKISPYHPALLQFMEKYYRNLGNLKKAKEYIRKRILFYGSSQDKDYWKYEEYMNKGEHAKALALLKKLIEKYPKKSLYWEGLYQYYLNHENFEKALETYIHLQRIKGDGLSPSGDYYYNLGRLALLAGRKEEAINYYKAYLNKEPDNINLRFFLAYLQKKNWDYSKDYEIKIEPFIEKAKKLSYPKAHSMVLIDQTVVKIWKDGSVSETVHMAHKILDEEGKNKYHTIYPNGEILQLRTIDPKGKVWEPIMPDQGSIVPPALMIGSVIEQKYRRNQSGSYPFQFRWGPFFFKDPNYDEPVLFSQLVVILEKGAPFKIFTHKIDEKRKKIINKENFNIYIWTFEKQDRTEIERFMPPPKEILPYVAIYSNQSFLNHLWKTLESYGPQIEPTPQIEEASQKILGSQKRTDLDKIKALYQYVQKAIPKGYGDGRYGNALRILMEKEGDRGVLFQSLLLAAKIDFAPAFAFPEQLCHVNG
ncbi:MAG: hypothetical protein D6785_07445 [Planctomycetota bacterium]|nr:MAG: hypothetical protein D6785_07445 [Planctomycetota bacterium]